ncbi:hypothetical protein H920_02184 [Fukomys damarensis]|uniref:Uncharacterized protein n=1 Tax=Fukomys damarensis TaxID=885580 RepID=A0A091E1I8_FUKDA|nr:hypothetical protein H920_02184 [Fukomys damarensis]
MTTVQYIEAAPTVQLKTLTGKGRRQLLQKVLLDLVSQEGWFMQNACHPSGSKKAARENFLKGDFENRK